MNRAASEVGPAPGPGGLVLIGYRGTGKTTVGRMIAARTGRPFADSDTAIEARAGRTVRQIFETEGEPAFRDHESAALADLTESLNGGILATGGGAILRAENRALLRRAGLVVWLTADPSTLGRRLRAGRHAVTDRPALTNAGTLDEIADVLAARLPLYREAAHVEVDTSRRSLEAVAHQVINAWCRDRILVGRAPS